MIIITWRMTCDIRDNDPEVWDKVQYLMDHDEERRKETEYWAMFQRNVVDFMRKGLQLSETYSEQEIHRWNEFSLQQSVLKMIHVQSNWNIEDECFPSGASLPGSPGHLRQGHLPHLLLPVPLLHGQCQVQCSP